MSCGACGGDGGGLKLLCKDCAKERIGCTITTNRIIEWLRTSNADGTPCSVEREMLAQRLERGEHLKK